MSRGNWESHKLLFGEDTTLKPCPFCGSEPYVDSCDRIIDIGCDKCGYHRHFHGFVQDEIETDVVASWYKDSKKAYEWYDKDAYQKAAAGWNERQNRLDEICENYSLTPYGVEFALEQYQTVICEITHGMMSKFSYYAKDILQVAQERWCETCDLKREPVKPETYLVMGTFKFYRCPECKMSLYTKGNYCPNCGRMLKWDE